MVTELVWLSNLPQIQNAYEQPIASAGEQLVQAYSGKFIYIPYRLPHFARGIN